MIEAPHPSTLGEILDSTAHIYRSRFLLFLGIANLARNVGEPAARTGEPA